MMVSGLSILLVPVSAMAIVACGSQQSSKAPLLSKEFSDLPTPSMASAVGERESKDDLTKRIVIVRVNHVPSGSIDKSSVQEGSYYESYDNATLAALAENGDGQAAAHYSVRIYADSPQDGQRYAVAAAALSGDPDPLIEMLNSHMDHTQARTALPYAFVAEQLGSPLASLQAKAYIEQGQLSQFDIQVAKQKAKKLYRSMEQLRMERIGNRFDGS